MDVEESQRRRPTRRGRSRNWPDLYLLGLAAPALALLVMLVALHSPPGLGAPPGQPPTFDPAAAAVVANQVGLFADRTPGSQTARLAVGVVVAAMSIAGGPPRVDRFSATAPDGTTAALTNIVATLPGASSEAIIVLARRDDTPPGPDLAGSAVGTAVMVELSRAFATLGHRKTLVFASVDGGSAGDAGARRLATQLGALTPIAVICIGAVASAGQPVLVADRGDGRERGAAGLVRAVTDAFAAVPNAPAIAVAPTSTQIADLIVPSRVPGPQAPFVDRALAAVTVGSGLQGVGSASFSPQLLGSSGQALNNLLLALDEGAAPSGPSGAYLAVGDRVFSGWVLALVVVSLLVSPVLLAVRDWFVDRRDRIHAEHDLLLITRLWLPLAGVVAAATLLAPLGLAPSAPYAYPFPGHDAGIGVGAWLVLGLGLGLGVAAVRLVPRPAGAARFQPRTRSLSAARATGVASCCLAVAGAPAVGAMFIPALHAWCFAEAAQHRGAAWRRLLALAPLAVPVVVLVVIGTDPAELVRAAADGRLPLAVLLGGAGVIAAAASLATG